MKVCKEGFAIGYTEAYMLYSKHFVCKIILFFLFCSDPHQY